MTFIVEVIIVSKTMMSAKKLREEIVGAIEDNQESGRTPDASATVGSLILIA